MAEFQLKAGAGKAEIRFLPEDFPLKSFTGIHDKIYVRVLLLESTFSSALVSVELTSLPSEAVRRFQKECSTITNIGEPYIFVSVTHTFSAPHIPPHIQNEHEQKLSDTMYGRISTAVREASLQAKESLGPASVEYCEASCCLNVNRNIDTPKGWWIGRSEEAFSDHTVRVLKFRHRQQVFAYIINYDIQASVMDKSEAVSGGRLISGDLAGTACESLEEENKGVAVFLPGCAGDQAPILQAVRTDAEGNMQDLHENGFVLARQMGLYLAERVKASKNPFKDSISPCSSNMGPGILFGTAILPEQEMKYATKELRPQKQYSFDLTGQGIPVTVALLCSGDTGILMTAPELNSRFGTKIRQLLGEHLLIGTLVNGGIKYLPEAEDFERITYQAMNTKLGPGSAEIFLETISNLKKNEGEREKQ